MKTERRYITALSAMQINFVFKCIIIKQLQCTISSLLSFRTLVRNLVPVGIRCFVPQHDIQRDEIELM